MTSPVEWVRVRCARCGLDYDTWYRGSLNLNLDNFDDDYIREATNRDVPELRPRRRDALARR